MQTKSQTILKSLDKAYKIQPISRPELETFKTNYIRLMDRVEESERHNESEENFKGHLMDFLKNTYYAKNALVAPKGKTDFVIHTTNEGSSPVGVLFEVKRPKNVAEMVTRQNLNAKAMQELMLYYLEERSTHHNNNITHLIITNVHEWFIFEAAVFERLFYKNTKLFKDFKEWKDGQKVSKNNDLFYQEIAKSYLNTLSEEIEFTYFDIRTYEKNVRNKDQEDDKSLIELYKIFSPTHLLKLKTANDTNKLNHKFYAELLHIIGLEEVKEGGKKLIQRKPQGKRDEGALLENCITIIENEERLPHVADLSAYGKNREEHYFNIGLELCITWVNRILFLKLLEAQLRNYSPETSGSFLNTSKIKDFDVLNKLFFQVLAKPTKERSEHIQAQFKRIPYLNSSLFDISTLEDETIRINSLDDSLDLVLLKNSVLRNGDVFKNTARINTLEYLFAFLDAYDFSSENREDIIEENRELISASVLGLIFEKINGYRDGSFYTPAFITEYMCKETITKAVLQKFNETKHWHCATINDLHNKIGDITEANHIFDSLHICDPAVGSGHFLVSALNVLIALKSELGILIDQQGKRLKNYHIEVIDDELVVLDEDEKVFNYRILPNGKVNTDVQRVQETLFHQKQTLIENCLFGVDINPNSVKICRLRLWIELLKNAYYTTESGFSELETLPNIDINIKQGNSLVSKYKLDEDLTEVFQKQKFSLATYRDAVQAYKDSKSKEAKGELLRFINDIKEQFKQSVSNRDPRLKKLSEFRGKRTLLDLNVDMYGHKSLDDEQLELQKRKFDKLISTLDSEIADVANAQIYKGSFEWRFEFPEVLNDKGEFVGFDVVIGNPPYFSLSKIKEFEQVFKGYETYSKSADIYCLFYEKSHQLLKNKGFSTFITSNSWMKTQYGESLRKFFAEHTNPLVLINIEDAQVFEEATVEANILLFQKSNWQQNLSALVLDKSFNGNINIEEYFKHNKLVLRELDVNGWSIGNQEEVNLKSKIEIDSILLKDWGIEINYGIKTGLNEAFDIDEATKNMLISEDSKNSEIIKPIFRGRDIVKFRAIYGNRWMIFTRKGIDISRYPTIEKYLFRYFEQLRPRNNNEPTGRKSGSYQWYEIQDNVAYFQDFAKEKIIWGELSNDAKFTFDDEGYFLNNTTFFIIGKNLKFLLAILNSKLAKWYFEKISTSSGMGTNRWLKYKVEQLPIKPISESQQLPFIEKVNQILTLKQSDSQTDTSVLEAEIDRMVYELYELTAAEILIVEGK